MTGVRMDQAITRAKMAAAAAGAVMTAAIGVVVYGVVEVNIAAAVGGGFATLAFATLLGVAKIRSWTVDTSAERAQLASAQQQAEDERTRYVAAQGALTQERSRMVRDFEAEAAALRRESEVFKAAVLKDLEAEKTVFLQQLEDERDAIKIESYEVGVIHGCSGIFDVSPKTAEAGKIVKFPIPAGPQVSRQGATAHPADEAPEAARDRGVARP